MGFIVLGCGETKLIYRDVSNTETIWEERKSFDDAIFSIYVWFDFCAVKSTTKLI